MRRSGRIVATVLQELRERIQPGWTTADIDRWAASRLDDLGGEAAFKGYHGFPASTCVCLNQEVVHGVPHPHRIIHPGDLVKVDLGASVGGWHSDASMTIGIEPLSDRSRRLIETTHQALQAGLDRVRSEVPLQDISGAIAEVIQAQGYQVSQRYMGHGIGLCLHEWPPVPNAVTDRLPNPLLQAGMTLAIEPIALTSLEHTQTLSDGWTVALPEGELAAQWEHTICVTSEGCEILTSLG